VSDFGKNNGHALNRLRYGLWPCLALLAGLCCFSNSFANNGMTPHGYGTKNKAMGGAGIALPGEAAAVINNPATALLVAGQMQAGISVFHPRANYYTTESSNNGENGAFTIGPNEIDAEKEYLFQPYFATSAQLQENSAVAMALYTRSGMNLEYRGGTATFDPDGDGPEPVQTFPGTLGDGDTKWRVYQVLLDMTYARQVSEKISLGFTGVLATQSFKIKGVGSLAPLTETYASSGGSVMPENLSDNRNDWSYGAGIKVGLHAQWTRTISVGLMYQSRIYMSKHKDYSDLLPDHGKFDIPANLKIGFTWQPLDNLAFSIDAERIFHQGVGAISNTLDDLFRCPTANHDGSDLTSCLGGKNGGGLGWRNMNIIKIGGSWGVGEKWTLFGGFSFADQPIRVSETTNNLFTPYLAEAHYTFGFSRTVGDHAEVIFSAAYSEEESQLSVNRFDTSQELKIESDQFDFELSYSWRF
jgi:long-chain fatty acid transport protein